MGSTFGSIETLISSLRVQSLAQQIVNHNLANANTRGYSRQVAVLSSTAPLNLPSIHSGWGPAQIGTGVTLSTVSRVRDQFLDIQLRSELSMQGERHSVLDAVNAMAILFPELSATPGAGLLTALDGFFTDFSSLASNPTGAAERTAVVQGAANLASFFNDASRTMEQLMRTADARVRDSISRINNLLNQVATANAGIATVMNAGGFANDLMDKRDLALSELASLIKIDVAKTADGSVMVMTGSARTLVRGDTAAQLVAIANPHEPAYASVGLKDALTGSVADITTEIGGGTIRGQLVARDQVLADQLLEFDELAHSLIRQVNALHRAGYAQDGATTDLPFFTGTLARNIAVNSRLEADVSLVAASRLYSDGTNGEQAESIALLNNMVMNATGQTFWQINAVAGSMMDPEESLNSIATTGLNMAGSNSGNLAKPLTAALGAIKINDETIGWNDGMTIYEIIDLINNDANLKGSVRASFDYTTQQFTLFSDKPLSVTDVGGNLTSALRLVGRVASLAPINNGITPDDREVLLGSSPAMDVLLFRSEAAPNGTVTINGVSTNWSATQTLAGMMGNIWLGLNPLDMQPRFEPSTQEIFIEGKPTFPGQDTSVVPIKIADTQGNFSMLFNVEAQPTFTAFRDAMLAQAQAQTDHARALADQSDAAVAQLELQQEAITKVDIEAEKARLIQYIRAYEGAVQAMAALDEVLNTLINRMAVSSFSGGSTSSVLNS